MATGSYIDIDFEADGQNFQRINIDGTDYFFRTKWNSAHEFFIVFIYDTERNFLYAGRLVYGQTFPAYNVRGVGFSVPTGIVGVADDSESRRNRKVTFAAFAGARVTGNTSSDKLFPDAFNIKF